MILSRKSFAAMGVMAVVVATGDAARAALTFTVDAGSPWPSGWYNAAVANMQTVVNEYNSYGDFGNGNIYVYYDSGIPTAQSGYGGWGGSIGDGGTYPNVRVLLHESSHWLGTGTYSANWYGPAASALIQQFDGVGAALAGDSQHYWPYGENYDNESSPINDARHVAMVYALRKDFGIGSTAPPSSATSVTLTASDALGTSGFNYPSGWSDGHFPQPGTNYSTGNYLLRTPASGSSFNFAGESLTINNTNGISGGLLYKGTGATAVTTFKNLILDSGYVRHANGSGDLFQLAGKVTLKGTSTIDAAQGNIKLLAGVSGTGSLVKSGSYTLTLTGNATYTGDTTINAGILRLAPVLPVASYTFDNVSGSTVVNGGSGGAGMNGTLANGAAIVSAGQSGNAVSLATGASVDINNPITDLGNQGSWTVSAWLKTATTGATLLTKGDGANWSSGNTIFYLGNGNGPGSGGTPSAVRWGGGFFQSAPGSSAVNDNTWHQVTYVNSGGTYALFVDGVQQSLSSSNSSFGNLDVGSIVRLGVTTDTFANDGTANFNGLLDNVQFYNQALSPEQAAALFQSRDLTGTLPSTTNVTIAAGAVLDLNNINQTIASLSGPAGSTIRLGSGQLTVSSAANSSFAGTISGAGGSLIKSGAGTLTLSGANTYTGPTAASAGVLALSKSLTTSSSVSASGTGTVQLVPGLGNNLVIKTPSVSVTDAGKIDITDNKLIDTTAGQTGSWNGTAYDGISGLVQSGRNGGSWNGAGIITSVAQPNNLTTIGVAKVGDIKGIADDATATIAGQTVHGSDTLAMYTYGGDANLDGVINIDDYGRIDSNVGLSGTVFGWYNGDFNYDGAINIDDYGIIDGNIRIQGAPIATGGSAVAGVTTVPEPTAVSVAGVVLATLLASGRRRRSRGRGAPSQPSALSM